MRHQNKLGSTSEASALSLFPVYFMLLILMYVLKGLWPRLSIKIYSIIFIFLLRLPFCYII